MSALVRRIWDSPTITTWASVAVRGLSLLLVLPLLLTRLTTEEIAVWYLLTTVLGLQFVADGFAPTFSRGIAYAMGGATEIGDLRQVAQAGGSGPNWDLVGRIWHTMHAVYRRLSVLLVLGLASVGTFAMHRPISSLQDPSRGWLAWAVVVVACGVALQGSAFSAYLQGVNEIALLRRWEALMLVAGILTSVIVLLAGGGLLALILGTQLWALVGIVRNWQLCRFVQEGRLRRSAGTGADATLLRAMWPNVWRSGLGVSFSRGMTLASGLIYAQIAKAPDLAAYLLAFRFVQVVSDLSNAPFYSKLALLARLRAEGRLQEQLAVAQRGMRLAFWMFVTGFWTVGLGADPFLTFIGSRAEFVPPLLWGLLGLAFFVERFGAMHLQLYSTTNHIIWHVANGMTGAIYLLVSLAALPSLGVYAFALAFLVGNAGFYAWYSALHSYRTFRIGLRFESTTAMPPLAAMLLFCALAWRAL